MTVNPYLMGGSSKFLNKLLMVFTVTDLERLFNLFRPEPVNTPVHQNWIHRRPKMVFSFTFRY